MFQDTAPDADAFNVTNTFPWSLYSFRIFSNLGWGGAAPDTLEYWSSKSPQRGGVSVRVLSWDDVQPAGHSSPIISTQLSRLVG